MQLYKLIKHLKLKTFVCLKTASASDSDSVQAEPTNDRTSERRQAPAICNMQCSMQIECSLDWQAMNMIYCCSFPPLLICCHMHCGHAVPTCPLLSSLCQPLSISWLNSRWVHLHMKFSNCNRGRQRQRERRTTDSDHSEH